MKKNKLIWEIGAGAIVVFGILAYYLALHESPVLLFGLVGLICLTILLFIRPDLGLIALLVVRPMVDIFGTYTVNIANRYYLNLAAILSLLAIVWSLWVLIRRRAKVWRRELFWPIIAFTALSVFSTAYSVAPSATATELLRIISFFLLYFVARELITDLGSFQRLSLGLAASLAIPTLVGFYQVATHTGLTFADSTNRAYGTFGHPNVLAFYLVLAISFLAMYLWSRKSKASGEWALIGVLVLLLIFTFTRGAWIGLLLSLGLIGLIRFRRHLLGGLLALVVLIAVLPSLNVVTTSVFDLDLRTLPVAKEIIARQADPSSFQWRLDLWTEMSPRFYQRPVFGFGLGAFPVIQQWQQFDFFQGVGAHNDYLRLLLELGAAGLAVYALLLIAIFYRLAQTYRSIKHHPLSLPVLGIIGFSAAFVLMSLFDNLLQSTPVMWGFMIMLGAVLNLNIKKILSGK